jgi:hypothetical protein
MFSAMHDESNEFGTSFRVCESIFATRAFLSLGEKLHSCFLERSRQQEATPSFASVVRVSYYAPIDMAIWPQNVFHRAD